MTGLISGCFQSPVSGDVNRIFPLYKLISLFSETKEKLFVSFTVRVLTLLSSNIKLAAEQVS